MPRFVRTPIFDDPFASRRDSLIATVRQHLPSAQSQLQAVAAWLDDEFSEQMVREVLDREDRELAQQLAGQPPTGESPTAFTSDRDQSRPGDSLRAERLERAFVALSGANQGQGVLRLLGRNLPRGERQRNALRVVVVCACILDPDAGKWLGSVTSLATCPWAGDLTAKPQVRGRADIDRLWGVEALDLLEAAYVALGWGVERQPGVRHDQGVTPEPPEETAQLPTKESTSPKRRANRTAADKTEDELRIAAHLAKHPDATRDEVAEATGVATAHVSGSGAWKARKAQREEARKANRTRGSGGVGDPSVDRRGGPSQRRH